MASEQPDVISAFNEAAFQVQRIHNIWLDLRKNRERGNLLACKWILDSLELELYYDAKKLSEDYLIRLEKINKEIDSISLIKKSGGLLYIKLMEKEKLLREILQESGKGSTYKRKDEDELD